MPFSIAGPVLGAAAGAAVSGAMGGGGGGGGQVAQGAANIAGGMLSGVEAQQFANQLGQIANPFGQYNNQFGAQLAGLSTPNAQGQSSFGQGAALGATMPAINYANATQSTPTINALNGVGTQLANLVANPSSIYSTPQYQSAFQQGQSAVNATLGAQGLNESGNQLAALQNYGQSFGANYYNQMLTQLSGLYGQNLQANQQGFNQLATAAQLGESQNSLAFNQLSQLSGLASGSPTAAAAAESNVFGNVNSSYDSVGQGIGQVASGVGNLLNGLNTPSTTSGNDTYGFGGTTTTSGFGDVGGSGGLFGTSAGFGGDGYTYSGGNSFGFTG